MRPASRAGEGTVPGSASTHSGHPPQRATIPKTGGRLTQAPAGNNPTTGQAVVILKKPRVRRSRSRGQFDKPLYGQSEISSTSCPSACWRLWSGDVITVRFPLVCCPQYGVFWYPIFSLRLGGVFSRFVLLIVRVSARKMEEEQRPCGGGVSGPLGARSLCCSCCCQA